MLNRLRELGIMDLEPWRVMTADGQEKLTRELGQRYPDRQLIAFARRVDNDDCACFDLAEADGVISVVHDFASPGWEQRQKYEDIRAWLAAATVDFADFEPWE